ncbi:MAG TPA: hypothetical protein DEA08_11630 [Planctomycetes bacterium]|nr:hypothetical protein [Planctomycetota bacterium]
MFERARERDEALGRLLVEQEALSREDLAARLAEVEARRATTPGASLAGLLLERQAVSPATLEAALRGEGVAPPREPAGRLGPYRLLRKLGVGGMGAVYEAEHVESGVRGALKTIQPALLSDVDEEERLRFCREAELLARLDHPGVVAVHSAELGGPRPYLVMDLVSGESLAERLRGGPLEIEEALRVVRELARALGHCHAQGILHRDLKPANVVLDERGAPRLVDFGLALALDAARLTASGVVLGTPGSMAPEQATGSGRTDVRTDVYGLGALLFELLCGQPPFRGASLFQTLDQIVRQPPPHPSALRPGGLPAWLDRVVLRALAKEPEQRFPDVASLAAALAAPQTQARKAVGAGAVLLVVSAIALGALLSRKRGPQPGSSPGQVASQAAAAQTPGEGGPHPAEGLQRTFSAGRHAQLRYLAGGDLLWWRENGPQREVGVLPRGRAWGAPPKLLRELQGRVSGAVSPSRARWVIGCEPGLLFYDGSELRTIEGLASPYSLAFVNERLLAMGQAGPVLLFDLERAEVVAELPLPAGALSAIRLAGGGGYLAAVTNGTEDRGGRADFCCWRVSESGGSERAQLLELAGLGSRERGRPHSVAISPDGTRLALGNKMGALLEVELGSAERARRLGSPRKGVRSDFVLSTALAHDSQVEAVCYSSDVRRLYSASATNSRSACDMAIWDIRTGELIGRVAEQQASLAGVDAGPTGAVLLWDGWGKTRSFLPEDLTQAAGR